MDELKPEGQTIPQNGDYVDKPLGRGLADISHLFLSGRTPDAQSREVSSRQRVEKPTPPSGCHVRSLLLKPCSTVNKAALAAMVRELQGAVEDGFCIIDASVQCPPAGDIDLLGIDRSNQLCIVDLDTASNDGLLLRGIAHYDWIFNNLSNVQRMHAGQSINSSAQ